MNLNQLILKIKLILNTLIILKLENTDRTIIYLKNLKFALAKESHNRWHGKCLVCDAVEKKIYNQLLGNYEDNSIFYAPRAEEFYYANILVIENGINKGPFVWEFKKNIFDKIMYINKFSKFNITDITNGSSLQLETLDLNRPNESYRINVNYGPVAIDANEERVAKIIANIWDLEKVTKSWEKDENTIKTELKKIGISIDEDTKSFEGDDCLK